MKKVLALACTSALVGAMIGPRFIPEAEAAINYPSVFGQLTGDCTTTGANSYATTCTKTGGVAFGSAATANTGTSGATIGLLNGNLAFSGSDTFTNLSSANITMTGGSINGSAIGATTASTGAFTTLSATGALTGTTATFSGLTSGVANTFTGLSTQTGGHIIGVGDYTAAQTLVAANEDVTFTCTASCAATLPAGQNGLALSIQDLSTTAGFVVITPTGSGTKVMTPSGPASTYTYSNLYQGAKWVYHSGPNLWVAE